MAPMKCRSSTQRFSCLPPYHNLNRNLNRNLLLDKKMKIMIKITIKIMRKNQNDIRPK